MKRIIYLLTLSFCLFSFNAFSTHFQSGEISAKHITGNTYEVTFKILTDCYGVSAPTAASLNFDNGSSSFTQILNQTYSSLDLGVNYSCSCYNSQSACNGGAAPGSNYAIYSGLVTLSTSNSWVISYSSCCRNNSSNNIINGGSTSIYVEATIQQASFPTNSTPFFPLTPRFYMGSTDVFEQDYSVIDYDNDSIVYSLIPLRSSQTVTATYTTGYSATSPVTGLTLNNATGVITYNGTALPGNYLLAIQADEYDRISGNLKSTVMRDFGLTILNHSIGNKYLSTAPISNGLTSSSSNITISGNTANICGNSGNSLNLSFSSIYGNVDLWSNIDVEYPGVTYSVNMGSTSTMTITLPPNLTTNQLNFYVQATADSTLNSNYSYDYYTINLGGFSTSGDRTICLGDTVHMFSNSLDSNAVYSWTYLSGTPIDTNTASSGYSFSCTNCPNPVITPTVTSTYIVNTTPNSCGLADTVTITVNTPPSIVNMTNDTVCLGDSVLLIASNNYAGANVWMENGTILSNITDSIWVTPSQTSTYTLTNPSSMCNTTASIHVFVPQPVVAPASLSVCEGDSVSLTATNGANLIWSPNASLSCSSCSTTMASPNQTTMYYISSNEFGCISEDSVLVSVLTARFINGTAYQSNATVLPNTKVLLIGYNAIDSTVTAVDSVITNMAGEFSFVVNASGYYVKILPDSATYPNEFPTYYGDEMLFLNASPVIVNACDTSNISITTISNSNPGGSGFISGNVYQGAGKTDAAGDPVVGIQLILVNDQNEPLAYSITDINGEFSFDNVIFGEHKIFMDRIDANNQDAPLINVNSSSVSFVYNFKLDGGTLIRTSPNSVKDISRVQVSVYPNPAQEYIKVRGVSNFHYTIIGIDGKRFIEGQSNGTIDISSLPKGAYFIKGVSNDSEFINPIIKK